MFLYNRTLFQGQHLPPSNAVLPSAPHHGYWSARKGRTTFPFSFRLPSTTPSSVVFAGNAAVRYVVKGLVQAWYQESKSIVVTKSEANVVERWDDEDLALYRTPVENVGETKLFMGGSGSVWVEAGVEQCLFMAGSKAMIRLGIRNASKRDTSGVVVHVIRYLTLGEGGGASAKGPTITDIVHSQHYRGQAFEFPSGSEVVLNVPIDIPQETRTIRKTKLFQVNVGLVVSLPMGTFAKDLDVKLPVFAAHPTSLQHAWDGTMNDVHRNHTQDQQWAHEHLAHHHQHHQNHYHHAHHSPMQLPPRSQSAMGHHGSHVAFPADQSGRGPSPAPVSPSFVDHPGMVSLPQSPLPFSVAPSDQQQPQQHVSWDANAQGWGASQFTSPQLGLSRPASAQPDLQQHHIQAFAAASSPAPVEQPYRAASVEPANFASASPSQVYQQTPPAHVQQQMTSLAPPSPQADGLSTIAEDSESAGNTVKSVWALGGDRTGAKRSVSPAEVELFERLVDEDRSQDTPPAPPTVSKDMGRKSVTTIFETTPPPQPAAKLAEAPVTPPKETIMANVRKPAAPAALPKVVGPSSKVEASGTRQPLRSSATALPMPVETPARPASAQGQGLTALEQRLASSKISATASSSPQPATSPARERVHSTESATAKGTTGLRAAAAARQQQQESQKDPITEQSVPTPQSKTLAAVPPAATGSKTPSSSSGNSERKVVDDGEARKLGKAAVRRVGGWLDETRSPKEQPRTLSSSSRSPPMTSSAIDTPKTPSSSALLGDRAIPSSSSSTSSIALGGGSLRRSALAQSATQGSRASEVVGGSAAASLTRSSSGLEALNRYRQATAGKIPKPKTENSSATDVEKKNVFPASASSSSVKSTATANSSASSVKVAPVFSRNVGPAQPVAQLASAKADETTNSSDSPTARSYDVRSARGGKGGRVASAASLWASIANGTDGKLPVPSSSGNGLASSPSLDGVSSSMRRTTVNARPMARRSMNGEAPPLDFTNREKVDQEIKRKEAEEEEQEQRKSSLSASSASPSTPARVSPKPVRPTVVKPAANAMPSAFSGHPKPKAPSNSAAPQITKRGAAPFLNTTAPKGQISSAALSLPGGGEDEKSVMGRGTTKPVGKGRMDELRSMFAT